MLTYSVVIGDFIDAHREVAATGLPSISRAREVAVSGIIDELVDAFELRVVHAEALFPVLGSEVRVAGVLGAHLETKLPKQNVIARFRGARGCPKYLVVSRFEHEKRAACDGRRRIK